jgi:membrane protease YdiL (CAAX protease family)
MDPGNRLEFDRGQVNIYVILLLAPILLSVYRVWGWADRLTVWFPSLSQNPLAGLYGVLFQWGSFFFLVLVIPFLTARFILGFSPGELGLGLGDRRFGLFFVMAALVLLVIPAAVLASTMPDVQLEYPLAKVILIRSDLLPLYEAAYVLLYYLAWEFFFRGFMLFPLARVFGGVNAVLIQTIPSCLIHIGKPQGELTGSVLAGLILGGLAVRTGSIWYGFFLHATLGVLVDLLIIFR